MNEIDESRNKRRAIFSDIDAAYDSDKAAILYAKHDQELSEQAIREQLIHSWREVARRALKIVEEWEAI